jgi:23S rRNA (uridine2552-2'-O)-methyltransferase
MNKSGNGGGGGRGSRELATRLKTSRGRTTSQQRWLSRQLNDPYVARARREGFRSRAAFKLMELDERHKILKRGQRVVDLGAAPGGWCQIAVPIIGAPDDGRIVAIDLLEIDPVPGVDFVQMDFLRQTDHLRTLGLVEVAAEFAREVLAPGGKFLAKVLQGGTEGSLLKSLKHDFREVKHVKPPASRQDSSELYVLAAGFRGRSADDATDEA